MTKIISAFCVCLFFEIYQKKTNAFNHNTCTQVKLVFKKYYSCYFHWRFSAIICYFPQFVFVFVDLLLLTDFAIFFTIFHYFLSLYTFNRFSTIFCRFSTQFCSLIYKGHTFCVYALGFSFLCPMFWTNLYTIFVPSVFT